MCIHRLGDGLVSTPGRVPAADLIATAAATGRTVIIVSNNSSYAILEDLAIHRIGPIAGVVGRG